MAKDKQPGNREEANTKLKTDKEHCRSEGEMNNKCFTPRDKPADRQKQGPICYRCGGVGHVAASEKCPEYGKKPTQAQIQAAHMIIIGTMEGVDDEDNINDSEQDSPSQESDHEQFSTMEFEEYDDFSEDNPTDIRDEAEHTHAMYE